MKVETGNVGFQSATHEKKPDRPLTAKEKEFLSGLEELTRKTGLEIWGCGCCESPSLIEARKGDHYAYYVRTDELAHLRWEEQ